MPRNVGCASRCSPTGASPTSAARASTSATSPRRWSTSATTSRCSAASPTPSSTRGCRWSSCPASTSTTTTSRCGCRACGSSSAGRLRRGGGVLDRPVPRAAGLQPAGLAAPAPAPRRVRPRPRQPVPRLRPAGDRSATGSRCSPPSTTRSPSTGASRWSTPQGWYKRLTLRRWYAFTSMQTRVAKRLPRVITVSENSFDDIAADHEVDPDRMHIVPVGVDPELFRPAARRRAGARAGSSPPPAPTSP